MNNFADKTKIVLDDALHRIYEEVKTPYKYGVVLGGRTVDSPSVFRHNGKWYMVYIVFDGEGISRSPGSPDKIGTGIPSERGQGYETEVAESDDLLHWKTQGKVLSYRKNTWDCNQVAGYIALQNNTWGGNYELQPHDGKYWISYLGGALPGYETDPLSVGIAWTKTPDKPIEWNRIDENPVLHPDQTDTRPFEKITLYKSNIIYDRAQTLGYPFVMFYNGKGISRRPTNIPSERGKGVSRRPTNIPSEQGKGISRRPGSPDKIGTGIPSEQGKDVPNHESIGMAVSKDMIKWKRYGTGAVVDNGLGISGDPQITKIGDTWVMFYYRAFTAPGDNRAFDTFACSYDLINWSKWTGRNLIESSEPYDEKYAHKPWVIKYNGVVYHFYCAVGTQGRCIALATSKKL